nr:macro domain-containing protein [Lachnospiraceae bacterium]
MKILYIHGLGSGKNSETPKRLRNALPEAEVLSPEIPIDPAEAMRFLEQNFLNDTSIDLVVGSSLGGFYSLLLKHHKKLLANPALLADEDIKRGIGLGVQEFLSERENGAKTYVIDQAFIRGLAAIRAKIFDSDPLRPGAPAPEQVKNTWAIFARSDELLAHYDDFCRLFRPDHAFRMEGEHRVSAANMQEDIVPLIRKIMEDKSMDQKQNNGIDIKIADITALNTDAIVNAANEGLWAGGGVCGAIFCAAGHEKLQKACSAIGHCDTGSAVITPGFALKAKYVIHAVGPVWRGGEDHEEEKLYGAYFRSLELALENGCRSVAFPLISSGIFGYPKKQAWEVAVRACRDFFDKHPEAGMQVTFAVLNEGIAMLGKKVLGE